MSVRRRSALLLPVLAAALVAILALVLRSPAPAASPRSAAASVVHRGSATVAISNYAYAPDRLTVKAGTRVTFVNHDDTAHTATADGGAFGTGVIQPGARRTVTLRRPGHYPYHCIFHAFMTGSITVVS